MNSPIRWGILGLGNIARQFATGLKVVPNAELVAVASRSLERGNAFADEFAVPRRHNSYEALAQDAEVDVVYIATPHTSHCEQTILCLKGGRHVLCEKPLAINTAEVERMIAVARSEERFLMEAMWTRFIPIYKQVRTWLAEGAIGEPRMLTADFGFRGSADPEGRGLNPVLAGGALLDVGIYPLALAALVFGGEPESVVSSAHLGTSGVDEQNAFILRYAGGELAVLTSAVRTQVKHPAFIDGTEGSIEIAPPFWAASTATLIRGGEREMVEQPLSCNGYEYEAEAVGACIRAGRLESEHCTLNESQQLTRIMDTIRAQWGLVYPQEEK